ncbi:MAG: hypothetical protein WCR52_11220 [Bacteroidota bacterium]
MLHFYRIQQIIVAPGRKTLSRNTWRNGIQVETPEGWLRITADYDAKAIEVQKDAYLTGFVKKFREKHFSAKR